jgi:hypothetical protein
MPRLKSRSCVGRETGCTGSANGSRCDVCRAIHNAREQARRQARRARCLCVVCGARAVRVDGVSLTTCQDHRAYYNARGALARSG